MPCTMPRWKSVLVAFDQFINALCAGWPDETISSRAWRWHVAGVRSWPCKLIDALFWFDPEHCQESYFTERLGRQLPPECRGE